MDGASWRGRRCRSAAALPSPRDGRLSVPPAAVCFDMDGVLVQSEAHWVRAQREAILVVRPNSRRRRCTGCKTNFPRFRRDDLEISREAPRDCSRSSASGFTVRGASKGQRPLNDLRDAGVALALTTSHRGPGSTWPTSASTFSRVRRRYRAGDIDGPGKPEPDIYDVVRRSWASHRRTAGPSKTLPRAHGPPSPPG